MSDDESTPNPSEWTIAFPANEITLVDGEPSAAVVDRALGLHSKRPRPSPSEQHPSDAFFPTSKSGDERAPLLSRGHSARSRSSAAQPSEDDAEESDWQERKAKPWYKRPSPLWMLPGTMLIAMSMGMILSPKVNPLSEPKRSFNI